MVKVEVIELIKNNKPIGFTPIIKIKGKKSIGIKVGKTPINFPSRKEAKNYGESYILEKNL